MKNGSAAAPKFSVFRFDDIEVHEREFSVRKAGEVLPIEPKAFSLLLFLLRNPGRLVSKAELLDAIWGDAEVTEHSLTRSIAKLRKLLDDDFHDPRYIGTVSKVGYRFLCPVETEAGSFGLPALTKDGEAEGLRSEAGTATAEAVPEDAREKRFRNRWGLAIGAFALLTLIGAILSLSRPLPPPRITAYVKVTRDGHEKLLGGTDGSRLYFTETSPDTIEQVSVNGGEIARVSVSVLATEMELADVSADGSSALILSNEPGHVANPMWVAPLLGGSARRLGDGQNAALSPDGLSVIYWTLEGDIVLARIDGKENRKLAHVKSEAYSFSWSPDSKAIRFTEGGVLWEMASDGSGLHRLLPDWKEPGNQCCGKWTHDGHFYVFDLDSPSSGSQIWALDERKSPFRRRPSEPLRLTTGPVRWGQLIPSRDGTRIFAEGITPRGELSRIDAKSGALQPLLGGISAEFPSFSPDGRSVAFVLYPEGTLWKADPDGSHREELAGGPDHIVNPRWSPDSKQILFTTTSFDGLHPSIHLISADGGNPQRLLPGDSADMEDANWSPDGRRILFARGVAATRNEDLRILDLASGQVIVLPGSSNMWSPRWSQDGRTILAMYGDSRPSLPLFDFATQRWSTIPVNGDVEFPSFSRDGRYIYFLRWGSDQGVIRIPVGGGKEERVVDMPKWHVTGYMGYSMTLDPTDAPLVLRDVGIDDIYALTLEQ
jgi:Tol biopolymer transport system component/DNA-binding winged helix-turn-helix (wHTH) protein